MKINNPIVLYFVLPVIAVFLLPPETLLNNIAAIIGVAVLVLGTGYFLWTGNPLALTFLIFVQGLNFIVRLMLFFSRSVGEDGVADWAFIVTSILSMALSFYLVFRLDEVDIRARLKA